MHIFVNNMFEYDKSKIPKVQKLPEMVRNQSIRAETLWKWSQIDIGSHWNTSQAHLPAYLLVLQNLKHATFGAMWAQVMLVSPLFFCLGSYAGVVVV